MVVGFDDLKFETEIAAELKRLRNLEVVRLVDAVVVSKSKSGELVPIKAGELSQEDSAKFGAVNWRVSRVGRRWTGRRAK